MVKTFTIYFIIFLQLFIFFPFLAKAEEIRNITFPIDQEWDYNFSDTFGAARAAGRTHEGTDIIVDQMTPLLAAVDGRVTFLTETERSWGMAIYIEDADGYEYHYLHVNNDTPGTDDNKAILAYAFPRNITRGTPVTAGQVIAFAGDSGNAENVTHHLHFEIEKPDGSKINPYASLMSSIGQPITTEEIIPITYQFNRDLELGSEGEDVRQLQIFLNQNNFIVSSNGAGSIGNETTYFGPATQTALIKFQQANNLPSIGYFGSLTRALINSNTPTIIPEDNPSSVQVGWLIKDPTSPKVYFVSQELELMWIKTEEAAIRHFGNDWNEKIREFPDLDDLGLPFGDYIV